MADAVFSDQNFSQEVEKASMPVLVDFWAPWCGPCKMVSPIVEELAKEFSGRLKVGKLNVDDNQTTSAKYGIMSIPSLLVFKKGKVIKTMIGAQSKDNIKKGIEEALAV